jgi:protein-tyrosine phosphatase
VAWAPRPCAIKNCTGGAPVPRVSESMRYALVFWLLGCAWVALACYWRGPGWIALWPGVSFALVGCAYGGLGPSVFGKRGDGRLPLGRLVLLLPYVLPAWTSWAAVRLVTSEPACSEASAGLWIGRRPVARELPPGVQLVVDLTCELWEPRSVRRAVEYVCEPTLDERFLPEERAAALIQRLAPMSGTIFIHCAQGHGRSATLAAALMVARGVAADLDDARRQIATVRPRIRIHPSQAVAASRALARIRHG